jgi:hypothetical protein
VTVHPWERRQAEREAQAAVDAVDRLERALAANAEELECRLTQLGEVRVAAAANHSRMVDASDRGVRIVFDGSRREAEPLWERVPMEAVATMERAITDGERLAEEESRLLGQVTNCERERDRLVRTLEHWTRVRDGLEAAVADPDAPTRSESTPTDETTLLNRAVSTEDGVEVAEALALEQAAARPSVMEPSVSVSARLAAIGKRISGW